MIEKLKKSKYAFFIKKDDGNYIAYSSLTGAVIIFSDEEYINRLKVIISKDKIDDDINDDIIQLLKSKSMYINEKTDEYSLVRTMYEENIIRSTNALEVMLIVTKQCNFRCTYCGQPHENKQMQQHTYDCVYNFIVKQLETHGYKKVKITFFGGEPLIEYENIICFLKRIKKLSLESKIEYDAGMSTNGYLLTPQRFKELASLNCISYQISVDGMGYTHNQTRPLVNGKETWEKIIDNLKYMITTDFFFSVTLRTNFNIDIAESMVMFYEYIENNLNDKRIHIYYETIKDHGNKHTPLILTEAEGMILNIDITEIVRKHNLNCLNATIRTKPCSLICYASKPNFFLIDEDGVIKKCSHELDLSENQIGTFNPDGSFNVDFQAYGKWVYKDYLSVKICKKCKALPLCLGKRCPRNLVLGKTMHCNTELIESEIEGIIKAYY